MTDFSATFGTLRTPGFILTANARPPVAERVAPHVEAELRHHGSTPEGVRELARFADMAGTDLTSVVDRLLEELGRGRIDVELRRPLPILCGPTTETEVDLSDLTVLESTEEAYAVELQLIDQDDVPVARAEYRLRLPDGQVRSGTLDEQGFARVDGLDSPDPCEVSFPRFDEQSWAYVHASPL